MDCRNSVVCGGFLAWFIAPLSVLFDCRAAAVSAWCRAVVHTCPGLADRQLSGGVVPDSNQLTTGDY